MNNLGNEVTIKVKEAIRAKLKEMNANSSDEIIDYIMLLVTTKKSSSELAKSISFLMENNTTIFVKWLSTIIKKLQQVTVSTTEQNISENLQMPNESIKADKINQSDDILICETKNLEDSEEEENKLGLSVDEKNNQISSKKEANGVPELNILESAKCIGNKTSPLTKIKPTISFCPPKEVKTKHNVQINKTNLIEKSLSDMEETPLKNNCTTIMKFDAILNKNISGDNETIICKKKRPRISINSDDEDEKFVESKPSITTKKIDDQITKKPEIRKNTKFMSQVIAVKSQKFKKDVQGTQKKLSMHDLIVQRVDHQRGALALDTAFKYIQQQIGASDKEIAVVKKWRDYAVEMLRSNKK